MRLPESARAVPLIEHAATVWRVHMSRMMRMGSMHGKRCLNQCAFCTANPLQSLTQSITESRHLHRTPSHSIALTHSITLHRNQSHSIALHRTHSIALHRNPWQQQAHRLNTQHGSNPAAAVGFEQVLGWLCARERGTWRCADADCQEDGVGELESLRRRRGLHREGSRV